MISFNLSAQVVDSNGETVWTQVTVQPSDDPSADWIDLSLTDDVVLPSSGNLMFDDPGELMQALRLAAAERRRFMRDDETVERTA